MGEHLIAEWDYEAEGPQELSFVQGQRIRLLERRNDDWYAAKPPQGSPPSFALQREPCTLSLKSLTSSLILYVHPSRSISIQIWNTPMRPGGKVT
ncbi:hypothetical protein BC936DRAFT_145191 [Jimgerdemannia flammicorona]|uniref:SH3 domain-containing protein n=1 Tax=Jimgerdemannia flammicorona TaxID=994334 RepID=A0A433DAN9_9FUNG|nr:hypothetical protein BC936DRAFT_145191 [Jimgerdemannia flammicorona]